MAEGNGDKDRSDRERALVLNHIAAQPAARTLDELHTSYDLGRDQVPESVQIGREKFEDHVKALVKGKHVKRAGKDPEGEAAYVATGD